MNLKKCNFCGSCEYENRKTSYLYSYKGNYLFVPDMPVEICADCGMVYYDAADLKEVERRFFAIQKKEEIADYIEIPIMAYA